MEAIIYCFYNGFLFLIFPFLLIGAVISSWKRFNQGVLKVWRERLGYLNVYPNQDRFTGEPRFWIHAASVGEVRAVEPLVTLLCNRYPRAFVAFSTFTPEGQELVKRLFPDLFIFFLPFDFCSAVGRAVARIVPQIFLTVETEIWPNLFRALKLSGALVLVVNGRISLRSYRQYRWLKWGLAKVWTYVDLIAVRERQDNDFFRRLNFPTKRLHITGNMKYDVSCWEPHSAESGQREKQELKILADSFVVTFVSIRPGEDEVIFPVVKNLDRIFPHWQVILIPRHPPKLVPKWESSLKKMQIRYSLLREWKGGTKSWLIVDTVGESVRFLRLSDIVFVGGSLLPYGGHNLIEPALLSKPVIFGPYTENFASTASVLEQSGGGFRVSNAGQLFRVLERLTRDKVLRENAGQQVRQAVIKEKGATQRNLHLIEQLLQKQCSLIG